MDVTFSMCLPAVRAHSRGTSLDTDPYCRRPRGRKAWPATNHRNAIGKSLETKPDVAVLDYSLPLMNGCDATKQILARLPKTEILIFTMHDSECLFNELLRAGAHGYLLKTDARKYLIRAVETLAMH